MSGPTPERLAQIRGMVVDEIEADLLAAVDERDARLASQVTSDAAVVKGLSARLHEPEVLLKGCLRVSPHPQSGDAWDLCASRIRAFLAPRKEPAR